MNNFIFNNEEFDYEAVLKSYSVQDIALKKSAEQKLDDYKAYNEALQNYKIAKKDFLQRDEKHQNLCADFNEKLNIKNSLNQLQLNPNHKLKTAQNEILIACEEMSKDSDNFVDLVNHYVIKFQNLGTEFEESVVLEKKTDCIEQIECYQYKIVEGQNRYDTIQKHSNEEIKDLFDISNLKETLKNLNYQSVTTKLKSEIGEFENNLSKSKKNIQFLKQRNRELQIQSNMLV